LLSVEDCAKLILCCSVHFKLYDFIPSTKVKVSKLIDAAIIFPYIYSHTYVIPVFFWVGEKKNKKVPSPVNIMWDKVNVLISKLVPGIVLDDLLVYSKKWWHDALDITELGVIWEKLLASSLAVKYYLNKLKDPSEKFLPLLKIYDLSDEGQAYSLLSKFLVNFSKGVIVSKKKTTVGDTLCPAVYLNPHHVIILPAKIKNTTKNRFESVNVTIQCKNSLTDPGGDVISKQLGCDYLLWFFLGIDEDKNVTPKEYTEKKVKDALEKNQFGFLNGAGCVSPLSRDLLIVLKNQLDMKKKVT